MSSRRVEGGILTTISPYNLGQRTNCKYRRPDRKRAYRDRCIRFRSPDRSLCEHKWWTFYRSTGAENYPDRDNVSYPCSLRKACCREQTCRRQSAPRPRNNHSRSPAVFLVLWSRSPWADSSFWISDDSSSPRRILRPFYRSWDLF